MIYKDLPSYIKVIIPYRVIDIRVSPPHYHTNNIIVNINQGPQSLWKLDYSRSNQDKHLT